MQIFVVNLARDTMRWEAVHSQLLNAEVEHERFPAVNGRVLPQEERRKTVNSFRWWCAVGRPVRVGEIGCALSHYGIYKMVKDSPVCILEDDVILDKKFKSVLAYVERNIDCSLPQVILLSNHTHKRQDVSTDLCLRQAKSDMYTEGYVITPLAADALLKANFPLQCPCDWWGRWVRKGIIKLYHAYPTVCSQDQTQYVSGTVDSDAFNVKNLSLFRFCLHKFLRLIGIIVDRMLPI